MCYICRFLFLVQVCHICIFKIILSYLRLPLLSTHFCRQHCDNGPKIEGFSSGFIFKPVTLKHFHLSAPKRPASLITPLKNSFSKGSNSMGTGSMPHNFWGVQVSLSTPKIMLERLIQSLVKTSSYWTPSLPGALHTHFLLLTKPEESLFTFKDDEFKTLRYKKLAEGHQMGKEWFGI